MGIRSHHRSVSPSPSRCLHIYVILYKLRFHIAFADGNKYGRMSDDELNDLFGYFKSVIMKDAARSVAVLIIPTLQSAKRKRGDRDERARIERKADAKGMDAYLCQLYMSPADSHGNDSKLRSYNMYVLSSDDDVVEKNPFVMSSYLVCRRGTMADADWVDPTAIYMPINSPGGSCSVSDMNIERRIAQLLGGQDVARSVLKALLTTKTGKPLLKPCDTCVWSHWTPMDGCLELVVRQESQKPSMPNMPCFSASTTSADVLACSARLMSTFLKDWKLNKEEYIVGETLKYSEELTEAKKKEIGNEDTGPPTLRLCTWVTENGNHSLALPDHIRRKWIEHAIYGEQWRTAIKSFNKATKALQPGSSTSNAADTATVAGNAGVTDEYGWEMMSEADIRAQNDIKSEFASEFPNIVYLASSNKKLYAVARETEGKLTPEKNVFCHGVGDWTKPPNAEKLLTKDTEDKCQTFVIQDDSEQCVLEVVPEGGRISQDTDASSWGDFLRELEDNAMGEAKIFGHKHSRPEGAMTSTEPDHFLMECTLTNATHWVWRPRPVDIGSNTVNASNVANCFPIEQLLASPKVPHAFR